MPVIVPEDYHILIFKFSLAGDIEPMVCTLGGVSDPAASLTDIALGAWYAATEASSVAPAAKICSDYAFTGVTVHRMTESGFETASHDELVQGTAGTECLPSNCALLVTKITNLGGRRGRGRFFWPPYHLDESNVDARGSITANLVNVQSSFSSFFSELQSPTLGEATTPVLFHSDVSVPQPTFIQSFRVESTIATQRDRMR